MDDYDFGYMVEGLYDFWLKELADYYIESMKPVMSGNDEEAKKAALNTLYICLDSGLRMLHPVMPYITEELFQRLPHRKGQVSESITIASWPKDCASFEKENVEHLISELQRVISQFRSSTTALQVPKGANPEIFIKAHQKDLQTGFASESGVVRSLVKSGEVKILGPNDSDPQGCMRSFISEDIQIFIKVVGIIDIKLAIDRFHKKNTQLEGLISKLQQKINMKGYESKVPETVRAKNAEQLVQYEREIKENNNEIANLSKLG
jgi:valyl-tRNA synthetase